MMRAVLLFAFWLLCAGTAQAATIDVTRLDDPAGNGNCPTDCSLRQAILFANPGDTVQLAGGANAAVYALTRGQLLIQKDVTILGHGPAVSGIDGTGNNGARLMKVQGTHVTLADLSFSNAFQSSDEVNSSVALNHNGGAAIFNDHGRLTVQRAVFEGNYSPAYMGAGISSDTGTLSLTDVDFHANNAYFGSALFLRGGIITADNVTVRDGDNNRGAIYLGSGGTLHLTNSTVTNNGFASAVGGGVVNAGGTLTLLNDTLAGNVRGSLLTYDGATTDARNTLFGAGFGGACVEVTEPNLPEAGPAVTHDQGHNIASDASCDLDGQVSQANADLRLAPIADNQGPTPTMALLSGSPAIGGATDCPSTDQRGKTRATCDAGAFWAQRLGQPTAQTLPPTAIRSDQATLLASLDLKGEAGALSFRYGTAPDQLTSTSERIGVGVVSAPAQRAILLQNLSAETTYYVQAVVENASGTVNGATVEFKTGIAPPEVYAAEYGDVTDTSADITFKIDPHGHDTGYVIKWEGDGDSGQTERVDVGAGAAQRYNRTITGLKPNTAYKVDVVATNDGGSATLANGPLELATTRQLAGQPEETVTLTDAGRAFGGDCPTAATIDWGDASAPDTSGDLHCADGAFTLTARHAYKDAGHYRVAIDYGANAPSSELWAQIASAQRRPTLTVVRNGPGRVTGGGIDCPSVCSISADAASRVTLTATPDAGATFTGWGGACSGTGPCSVTLDADKSVTATFAAAVAQEQPTQVPAPTPSATPTPAPPAPVFHQTVVVVPSGTVLVRLKGTKQFVPLVAGSIPLGAEIDATKGRVTLTSVPKAGGAPQTATFYGGIFTVTQTGGITDLRLTGPAPQCSARVSAGKKVKTRKLWGDGKGAFRTSGQYSAATVRGTRWLVEDSCSGTLTRVATGVVSVRDNVRHKTILLKAGKRYLARPRR